MDFSKIEYLKRLAVIAFFSDDYLMEHLVLKGGNALDLIYKISSRASFDLDFSMAGQFKKEETEEIEKRIENTLKTTFKEEGYITFDLNFKEKPKNLSKELEDFWGGYSLDFKFIEKEKYEKLKGNIEELRRNAVNIGNSTKCEIDISKFEYCKDKTSKDLNGYTIYVYTPEMIVFEKLRSICQQMPDYKEIVPSHHPRGRARDFFDIYGVLINFDINIKTKENIELLKGIFNIKKVPLKWIGLIKYFRDYHSQDFLSVKDTVKAGEKIEDFDYYFDFVIKKFSILKSLWEE